MEKKLVFEHLEDETKQIGEKHSNRAIHFGRNELVLRQGINRGEHSGKKEIKRIFEGFQLKRSSQKQHLIEKFKNIFSNFGILQKI